MLYLAKVAPRNILERIALSVRYDFIWPIKFKYSRRDNSTHDTLKLSVLH